MSNQEFKTVKFNADVQQVLMKSAKEISLLSAQLVEQVVKEQDEKLQKMAKFFLGGQVIVGKERRDLAEQLFGGVLHISEEAVEKYKVEFEQVGDLKAQIESILYEEGEPRLYSYKIDDLLALIEQREQRLAQNLIEKNHLE